jgi:hypothetical protein
MITSPEYRHVPTGTLAVLAQRLGKFALDVVPPRTEVRLATAPSPRASDEAEDWAAHDSP